MLSIPPGVSKMIYIKYLDPNCNTNRFFKVEELKELKPTVIEAVGYMVNEDENYISIANVVTPSNTESGKDTFKRVMRIPKDSLIGDPREVKESDNTREVKLIDSHITNDGSEFTLKKYLSLPKASPAKIGGFVTFEDEENIILGMEKNSTGMYRTLNILPKKMLKKEEE